MRNLLFYGTTNYGRNLTNSDILKFKELSNNFNNFVMTFGIKSEEINHSYVSISYIKKPKKIINQYLKFYIFNLKNLKNFCIDKNIQIISAKDPISGLIPILFKKLYKKDIKIIIEHHGDFLDLLLNQRTTKLKLPIKTIALMISNFVYKNCDLIRGVEKEYTKEVATKYNKINHYFPAWVDYSVFNKKDKERRNLIYVGNIIPRKGTFFIIENFYKFSVKYGFNEKLLIIGESQNAKYFKKCMDFIKDNNITNIEFLGKKSSVELSELYPSSRLLIMASNYEGLPRVLIESGLCATPSLATKIQGIESPFGSSGGTLLYELNDSNKFEKQLKSFIENKNLQTELQKQAYKLSSELSGKDSFLKNWKYIEEKIYE